MDFGEIKFIDIDNIQNWTFSSLYNYMYYDVVNYLALYLQVSVHVQLLFNINTCTMNDKSKLALNDNIIHVHYENSQ